MLTSPRAVIIANGEIHNPAAIRAVVRADDHIIAADGGANHCRALGLTPRALVGDLDSVTPTELAALEAIGTQVIKYPARKDQTDLELAFDYAITQGATEIIIIGALGGRWDQTLANVHLLALPRLNSARIRLIDGAQQISLLRGPGSIAITGAPGDIVSLIPISGDAHGVTTSGLEYPLENGTITFGSTLGISNVLTAREATVALSEGLLVCVLISSTDSAD